MSRGNWAFITEWTIYEYINNRYSSRSLRFKEIKRGDNLVRRDKWVKVESLVLITNTRFPDIDSIKLSGDNQSRVSEIKFKTSDFKYHIERPEEFNSFIRNNGFILSLKHDTLPNISFEACPDVYELDYVDFISFCRENFMRLINRQLRIPTENKIWVMYQGPNFNMESPDVPSAINSRIWCPTDNLGNLDLSTGDTVLFFKTKGASKQAFQSSINRWKLVSLCVAKVTSNIQNRSEYCHRKGISDRQQLWVRDPLKNNNDWRWNRVFEFRVTNNYNFDDILLKKFNKNLFESFKQAYIDNKSRQVSYQEYLEFMESVLSLLIQ